MFLCQLAVHHCGSNAGAAMPGQLHRACCNHCAGAVINLKQRQEGLRTDAAECAAAGALTCALVVICLLALPATVLLCHTARPAA
jgi:hypothetical protein